MLAQNLLCSKTFLRERKHFASEHKCFATKQLFCKLTVSREMQKICKWPNTLQVKTTFLREHKNFVREYNFFTSEHKVSWGMQKFCMHTNVYQVNKCFASKNSVSKFLKRKYFLGNAKILQANKCFVSQQFLGVC